MKKVRKRLWLFIIKVIFLLGGNRGFKKSFVCPFLFFSNISAYEANLFAKRANRLNTLYLINMFSRTNYTILQFIPYPVFLCSFTFLFSGNLHQRR